MEPLAASVLLATGAVSLYTAHRLEELSDKLRAGPTTLPEALDSQLVDDTSTVTVIAVHLRHLELSSHLAGERLRVCAKYGNPGRSVRCDSQEFGVPAPKRPATANFVRRRSAAETTTSVELGVTALFLGHMQFEPVVRLRLVQAGPLGRTLAKARFDSPLCQRIEARGLPWYGEGRLAGRCLGFVSANVETYYMPKGALRQCLAAVGAHQQKGSFLVGLTPIEHGVLERGGEEEEEAADGRVTGRPAAAEEALRGEPILFRGSTDGLRVVQAARFEATFVEALMGLRADRAPAEPAPAVAL